MKKFTLIMSLMVLASFTFAQVVGVHAPVKDKATKVVANKTKGGEEVVWSVTFEEDPAVWTIAHDAGSADWTVADTTITGTDFEAPASDGLPSGTMVSSLWLYMGHRDLGEYSESGGNFAWIDGITDLLNGTEEIKNAWVEFSGIDLSLVDAPKLSFHQNYKALNSAYSYLDISVDGGTTWTEIILNEGVEGNTYGDDIYETILTDYIANESSVTLRFRWATTEASISGYGYGWEIDDIKIVNNPDTDMILKKGVMNFFDYVDYTDPANADYFHLSSHYGMLAEEEFASDAAVMVFNGIVESKGNLDVTPDFKVQIFDTEMTEIYNETATGTSLSTAGVDTIDLLTEFSFDDVPAIGEYTVVYTVVADGDAYETDNIDTTYFYVTDSTFARDLGNPTSGTGPGVWLDGGNDGDMLATNYIFLYETTVESVSVLITDDSNAGTSMVCHLMQYDDGASDWVDLTASALVTVDETMLGDWYTFTFPDPVVLTPDTESGAFDLRAAIEFYFNGDNDLYIGYDPRANVSIWGAVWYFTSGSNANQWLSLSNWSRGGLSIRVNTPSSHEDAVAEINADEVAVYPNPSTGLFNIDNVRGADVEIFNLMGQRVFSATEVNENLSVDLSDLSEGTYVVRISGISTVKTQKINIVK